MIISFQRLEERIENQNVLIVAKIHGCNIYGKCETDVKIDYKSFWKMAGYYFKSYRDIYIYNLYIIKCEFISRVVSLVSKNYKFLFIIVIVACSDMINEKQTGINGKVDVIIPDT